MQRKTKIKYIFFTNRQQSTSLKKYGSNITTAQRSIVAFLIAMVCAQYCSNTFFMHSHVIDNEIVWHSHPFKAAQHTKADINTIALLNHGIFTCDTFEIGVEPSIVVLCILILPRVVKSVSHHVACISLRAPPACIQHI